MNQQRKMVEPHGLTAMHLEQQQNIDILYSELIRIQNLLAAVKSTCVKHKEKLHPICLDRKMQSSAK